MSTAREILDAVLADYTVTEDTRETLHLIHGQDVLDGETVAEWPINEAAPTLAEIVGAALVDANRRARS